MRVALQAALARLPGPPTEQWPGGAPFTMPFAHGSLRLVVFAPRDQDVQEPHEQDEVYIVVSGSGVLEIEGERFAFEPGDALFVPAGKRHQFREFGASFVTWAVFYGPQGGEQR